MTLTDTQSLLLSAAANRDDRLLVLPERLTGAAMINVARKLTGHQLVTELAVPANAPFWRQEEDGTCIGLRITPAGLAAINIVENDSEESEALSGVPAPSPPPVPRAGSKVSILITQLKEPEGMSIADLMDLTGWQAHTIHAALSRLRQKGHDLVRHIDDDGRSHYRILGNPGTIQA